MGVYTMDRFDKNEMGFSIDGNLKPKAHFYTNNNNRRFKVCVVDGTVGFCFIFNRCRPSNLSPPLASVLYFSAAC